MSLQPKHGDRFDNDADDDNDRFDDHGHDRVDNDKRSVSLKGVQILFTFD